MAPRSVVWVALGCLAAGCAPAPVGPPPDGADAMVSNDRGAFETRTSIDAGIALDRPALHEVGTELGLTDSPWERGAVDGSPIDTATRDVLVIDRGMDDTPVADSAVRDVGPPDVGWPDVGPSAVSWPDIGSSDVPPLPGDGVALPAWDSATVAHVRQVRARGMALGNRTTVFTKIGDSITESGSFLSDVGFGWVELGTYESLAPTIQYFQMTSLGAADINSFNRASVCATAGWTTDDALSGGDSSPLRRELDAIHPAWAIVMYGTNDIDRNTLPMYRANLDTIIDIAEAAGTVVALSTIPDRNDGAGPAGLALRFNETIRSVTAARHIPLLDYWWAMQPLPSHGVSADQIHPSVYVSDGSPAAGVFTADGLRYGYNVRNLTAIQMLDRMRRLP